MNKLKHTRRMDNNSLRLLVDGVQDLINNDTSCSQVKIYDFKQDMTVRRATGNISMAKVNPYKVLASIISEPVNSEEEYRARVSSMEQAMINGAAAAGVSFDNIASGSFQLLLEALLERPLTDQEIFVDKRAFTFKQLSNLLPRSPDWRNCVLLLAYGYPADRVCSSRYPCERLTTAVFFTNTQHNFT